jgi:hypothetical protein
MKKRLKKGEAHLEPNLREKDKKKFEKLLEKS